MLNDPLKPVSHTNGLLTLHAPVLTQRRVTHAFTTRLGGVSRPPYHALNLDTLTKDSATDPNTHVAENFRRLRAVLHLTRHIRLQARQVHRADVWHTHAQPLPLRRAPEADAIVTHDPAAFALVRTADCVPILIASEDGSVVAAIHAGWRGIVVNVIRQTILTITQHHPFQPHTLAAAIGPSIGPDHFEVGPEVARVFEQAGLAQTVRRPSAGQPDAKPRIDLKQAATQQLLAAGIPPENINTSKFCTYAKADLFYSHRRDRGTTGRMGAIIAPRST